MPYVKVVISSTTSLHGLSLKNLLSLWNIESNRIVAIIIIATIAIMTTIIITIAIIITTTIIIIIMIKIIINGIKLNG